MADLYNVECTLDNSGKGFCSFSKETFSILANSLEHAKDRVCRIEELFDSVTVQAASGKGKEHPLVSIKKNGCIRGTTFKRHFYWDK